jgi:small subunit ribosomal protein S4
MGHPRKSRKKYDKPPHPWNAARIKEENEILQRYGLKNKKEIWKAETMVRRYRRDARHLLGLSTEQTVKERSELLEHLLRLGFLDKTAQLEDVLDLSVDDVLKRRLQTMVHNKGFARSARQARLFVVHGHIALNNKKINSPSYLVKKGEEELIGFYSSSTIQKYHENESEEKKID